MKIPAGKRSLFAVGWLIALILLGSSLGWGVVPARPTYAQADEEEWSEPVLLSTTTEHSWFADLVVDGQGRLHVVWDSGVPAVSLDEPGMSLTMHAVREVDGTWSEPNDIATGRGTEISRPAIMLDRAGVLHMAFRPSGVIYYSQVDVREAHSASAWRDPYRLSQDTPNYLPDIVVDSQGVIHIVWSEWVSVELSDEEIFQTERSPYLSEVFYRRSNDGGVSWSPPLNLSRTPNVGSGRVQLEIDAYDVIHVTWEEGWDRNAQNDVAGAKPVCGMYRHSQDGGQTWSTPEVFDAPRTTSISFPEAYAHYLTGLRQLVARIEQQHPRYSEVLVYQRWLIENVSNTQREQEEVDSTNVLQARAAERSLEALEAERETIIQRLNELASSVLDVSFDELCDVEGSGAGQDAVEQLPQADAAQMTMGLDQDGGILLAWRSREPRRLYYAWSEDGGDTWGAVESVPRIYARPWNEPYDAYDMATDSLGHIHLVLVGTTEEPTRQTQGVPLGVYHLEWDGEDWSQVQSIVTYPVPSQPEYPKIAVGRGNHLHVVWGLRPEGLWAEGQQIWYSDREIDTPLAMPVSTPTPTPVPTVAPTPALVTTISPFPTVEPGSSSIPSGLYTERDDLVQLALALSPVLLVVIAAIAIRRIRRGA